MDKRQNNQLIVKQETSLTLSDQGRGVIKCLFKVNQLLDFPLDKNTLTDWTESIIEILPDITPEEIREVINGFMTGRYEYNNKLGIRNIFSAIELLRNNDIPKPYFQIP